MGTPIIRCGGKDTTPMGGIVVGVRQVFAEGEPIAAFGDAVTPHPHGNTAVSGTVMATGMTVFVGGQPVARFGDTATPPCGEPITPTSKSVFVA